MPSFLEPTPRVSARANGGTAFAAGRDINFGPLIDVRLETDAYRRLVAERFLVPAAEFDPRESDREKLIAAIQSGGTKWWWWEAEAWSGKTSAMADLFLRPPPTWCPVAFFVRQHESDNYIDFLRCILSQLADYCAMETLAVGLDPTAMAATFTALLTDAAKACASEGKTLVVLVDGLDEESTDPSARYPIVSLLPRHLPDGTAAVAASRANPTRVDADHPFSLNRHQLPPSPRAGARRATAVADLRALLSDPIGRDIGALLYVCEGVGLTERDLAVLTRHEMWDIDAVLSARIGRSFSAYSIPGFIIREGEPRENTELGYGWAHSTLPSEFSELAGPALRRMRRRGRHSIRKAIESHRAAGWPDETPRFLLTIDGLRIAYEIAPGETLFASPAAGVLGDRSRSAALYRRGVEVNENLLLTVESATQIAQLSSLDQDDLIVVGRLLIAYQQLVNSADVPTGMPRLFMQLGGQQIARHLATSIADPARRQAAMRELCVAFARRGEVDAAIGLLSELSRDDAEIAHKAIASAYIRRGACDEAEAVVSRMAAEDKRAAGNHMAWFARELARAGHLVEAEVVADHLKPMDIHLEDYYAALAEAHAGRGEIAPAMDAFKRVWGFRSWQVAVRMSRAFAGSAESADAVPMIEALKAYWEEDGSQSSTQIAKLLDELGKLIPAEFAAKLAAQAIDDPPVFGWWRAEAVFFAVAARAFSRAGNLHALSVAGDACLSALSRAPLNGGDESGEYVWLHVYLAARFAESGESARAEGLVDRVLHLPVGLAGKVTENEVVRAVTQGLAEFRDFEQIVRNCFAIRIRNYMEPLDETSLEELANIALTCTGRGFPDLAESAANRVFDLVAKLGGAPERALFAARFASHLVGGVDKERAQSAAALAIRECLDVDAPTSRAEVCVGVAEILLASNLREQANTAAQIALSASQSRGAMESAVSPAWSTGPSDLGLVPVQGWGGQRTQVFGVESEGELESAQRSGDSSGTSEVEVEGRPDGAAKVLEHLEPLEARVAGLCVLARELITGGIIDEAERLARAAVAAVKPGGDMIEEVRMLGGIVEALASTPLQHIAEEAAVQQKSCIVDFAEPHDLDLAWESVCMSNARLGHFRAAASTSRNIQIWRRRALSLSRAAAVAAAAGDAGCVESLCSEALESARVRPPSASDDQTLLEMATVLAKSGALQSAVSFAQVIRAPSARYAAVDAIVRAGAEGDNAQALADAVLEAFPSVTRDHRGRLLSLVSSALGRFGEAGLARRVIARAWLVDSMAPLQVGAWANLDFGGDQDAAWRALQ